MNSIRPQSSGRRGPVEGDRLLIVVGPVGTRPTSFDGGDGIVHAFQREEEKK